MKKETFERLSQELNNRKYEVIGEYGLDRLFDIYLDGEIQSIEELRKIKVSKFRDFVLRNKLKININDNMESEVLEEYLNRLVDGFIKANDPIAWYNGTKEFVNTIKFMYPSDKYKSVLDVGAGAVPTSSILLAQKYPEVTSMDYSQEVPTSFLKHFNVKYPQKFFSAETDVSKYDLVVGKRPCKAIENVVKVCSIGPRQDQKPFFIELCNCSFDRKKYKEIYKYLKEKYNKDLRMVERHSVHDEYFGEPTTYIHNDKNYSDKEISRIITITNGIEM